MDMLEALHQELSGVAEERRWKRNLPSDLKLYLESVSEIVRSFGELVVEYNSSPITTESLRAVQEVWERAERLGIPIKEVKFKIHGPGYDFYDGTSFQALEKLNEAVANPRDWPVLLEPHKLIICMK